MTASPPLVPVGLAPVRRRGPRFQIVALDRVEERVEARRQDPVPPSRQEELRRRLGRGVAADETPLGSSLSVKTRAGGAVNRATVQKTVVIGVEYPPRWGLHARVPVINYFPRRVEAGCLRRGDGTGRLVEGPFPRRRELLPGLRAAVATVVGVVLQGYAALG